jgi:hypothetical protein
MGLPYVALCLGGIASTLMLCWPWDHAWDNSSSSAQASVWLQGKCWTSLFSVMARDGVELGVIVSHSCCVV